MRCLPEMLLESARAPWKIFAAILLSQAKMFHWWEGLLAYTFGKL